MNKLNYVNDLDSFQEALGALQEPSRLAIDCETYTDLKYENAGHKADEMRTNPHTGKVSLLSIAKEKAAPYVFDIVCLEALKVDLTSLGNLLRSKEYLIAHNAKFEAKMLSRYFGWFSNWHCTLVAAQLYANATGSKLWRTRGLGLDDLCRDWLNVVITGKGKEQITQWYSDPISRNLNNAQWLTKLEYAATDVIYLFKLHDILSQLLNSPLPNSPLLNNGKGSEFNGPYGLGMENTLVAENYLVYLVGQMETEGMPYSPLVERKFKLAVEKEHQRLGLLICKELGLATITDGLYGDDIPSVESATILNNPIKLCRLINEKTSLKLNNSQGAILRRSVEVLQELARAEEESRDALIEYIEGEDSIYDELAHLSLEAKEQSFNILNLILDYKRLTKQKGMFLAPYVNKETGRVHSRFNALGAATGRFANSSPNIQQISGRLILDVQFTLEELKSLVDLA
jgi:hypothetical protein